MGRSNSYPAGAQVCFTVLEPEDEDQDAFDWECECLIDHIIDTARGARPAYERDKRWLGRHDSALVRNAHAHRGDSTLGSMVAIWVVERADGSYHDHDWRQPRSGRAEHWLCQIAPRFEQLFGDYVCLGHMSNGEGVYQRRAA